MNCDLYVQNYDCRKGKWLNSDKFKILLLPFYHLVSCSAQVFQEILSVRELLLLSIFTLLCHAILRDRRLFTICSG